MSNFTIEEQSTNQKICKVVNDPSDRERALSLSSPLFYARVCFNCIFNESMFDRYVCVCVCVCVCVFTCMFRVALPV